MTKTMSNIKTKKNKFSFTLNWSIWLEMAEVWSFLLHYSSMVNNMNTNVTEIKQHNQNLIQRTNKLFSKLKTNKWPEYIMLKIKTNLSKWNKHNYNLTITNYIGRISSPEIQVKKWIHVNFTRLSFSSRIHINFTRFYFHHELMWMSNTYFYFMMNDERY